MKEIPDEKQKIKKEILRRMSSEEGNCGGRKEKPGRKEHIH